MTHAEYWQNFELGKEIDIASNFVYDGFRNLHEMKSLHYEANIFNVLYGLSVGIERFLKIALILLEVSEETDFDQFEEDLSIHNHRVLVNRIRKHHELHLGSVHNELIGLLSTFYKVHRYDRYSVHTVNELAKEKRALLA